MYSKLSSFCLKSLCSIRKCIKWHLPGLLNDCMFSAAPSAPYTSSLAIFGASTENVLPVCHMVLESVAHVLDTCYGTNLLLRGMQQHPFPCISTKASAVRMARLLQHPGHSSHLGNRACQAKSFLTPKDLRLHLLSHRTASWCHMHLLCGCHGCKPEPRLVLRGLHRLSYYSSSTILSLSLIYLPIIYL